MTDASLLSCSQEAVSELIITNDPASYLIMAQCAAAREGRGWDRAKEDWLSSKPKVHPLPQTLTKTHCNFFAKLDNN